LSSYKGNLPKFLVQKFGEDAVRSMIAPDEKLSDVSRCKRAFRRSGKRYTILLAVRRIYSGGDRQFRSADVGKLAGVPSTTVGGILRCTKGVRNLGHGYWEFTGDPIEVEP